MANEEKVQQLPPVYASDAPPLPPPAVNPSYGQQYRYPQTGYALLPTVRTYLRLSLSGARPQHPTSPGPLLHSKMILRMLQAMMDTPHPEYQKNTLM